MLLKEHRIAEFYLEYLSSRIAEFYHKYVPELILVAQNVHHSELLTPFILPTGPLSREVPLCIIPMRY
jgi:hypothetical protein